MSVALVAWKIAFMVSSITSTAVGYHVGEG